MPRSATPAPLRLAECATLEDLPNVGPSIAGDLRRLGVRAPHELRGRDPYALYDDLNRRKGARQDPCVLDTLIAVVRFAGGEAAQPWWAYTAERKRVLAARASGPARRPVAAAKTSAGRTSGAGQAVAGLRNLGPASARMLAEAGITSPAGLRKLGAVRAWLRVRARHPRASLNLLWALEGALVDRDWQAIARSERTRLLLALDEAGASPGGRVR